MLRCFWISVTAIFFCYQAHATIGDTLYGPFVFGAAGGEVQRIAGIAYDGDTMNTIQTAAGVGKRNPDQVGMSGSKFLHHLKRRLANGFF